MVQADVCQMEEEIGGRLGNRNVKPRRMDKMDNTRKEAELRKDLADGTTPYSVPT